MTWFFGGSGGGGGGERAQKAMDWIVVYPKQMSKSKIKSFTESY